MINILFFLVIFFAPYYGVASEPLFREKATSCCPSVHTLEKRADMVLNGGKIGLNKQQLILAFRFIETMTKENVNVYTAYESRVPCVIERSDLLNGFLIRSIRSKDAFIGRGSFKTVTKVILYGPCPKVLAEGLAMSTIKQELNILEQLKGAKGIVPYYGAVCRERNFLFYYEYFPQGTIGRFFLKNNSFSPDQIIALFLDIAKGVRTLHEKGLVHRDLHEGNILIDISPKRNRAVLIDFGLTVSSGLANDGIVQGSFRKCPPEVLVNDQATIDRYAVDVYALGSLLYQTIWGKINPWAEVYNIYLLARYRPSVKKKLYKRIFSMYASFQEKDIGQIITKFQVGDTLTSLERLQVLAYQMLDVFPQKRPTINEVISILEKLLLNTSTFLRFQNSIES